MGLLSKGDLSGSLVTRQCVPSIAHNIHNSDDSEDWHSRKRSCFLVKKENSLTSPEERCIA